MRKDLLKLKMYRILDRLFGKWTLYFKFKKMDLIDYEYGPSQHFELMREGKPDASGLYW